MKWLAALLMITNVAVYLWAGGRQIAVDEFESTSKPDVNKEGMLLLRETMVLKQIESIDDSQQTELENDPPGLVESTLDVAVNASDSQKSTNGLLELAASGVDINSEKQLPRDKLVQSEDTIAEVDENLEQTDLIQISIQACYRVGPFKKEALWLLARDWMTKNGIEFQHVTSESRELRAVRVFLGPYDSISATAPIVEKLKEKNLDHFVYLVENGLAHISLGYFTQEALVAKFLSHLKSIGVQAQSQPEYRVLGPFNWMEIPIENIDKAMLATHDWKATSVELSQVGC